MLPLAATQASLALNGPLLDCYDFATPFSRHALPRFIDEASGLASPAPGVFITHNDGSAQIYELRPQADILRVRNLNPQRDHSDFEGVTLVDQGFVLLNSRGVLWRIAPDTTSTQTVSPGFVRQCNFEGIALQTTTRSLTVACKHTLGPAAPDNDTLNLYRIPVDRLHGPFEVVAVNIADLRARLGVTRIRPSALEWVPAWNRWLVLAGKERVIVELSANFHIVSATTLKRRKHPQAEGLSVDACGQLAVVDESHWWQRGRLTLYAPAPRAGAPHCAEVTARLSESCRTREDKGDERQQHGSKNPGNPR